MLSATTLKRSAVRRTFPLDVRSSVCRNLFGPIDHDELDRELKSELREICDRDQRRWNFNFESDTPLSGEYDWEEAPVATTPVFYHETVHIGKRSITLPVKVKPCMDVTSKDCTTQDVGGSRAVDSLLSSSESTAPGTSEVNQENLDNLNSGKRRRRKRTSTTDLSATTATRITDFYAKRRRFEQGKKASPNAIPEQETPRKTIR